MTHNQTNEHEQSDLRVSIFQYDLVWEDKQANLDKVHQQLEQLKNQTDLLVLPEMFSTGFSMNCQLLAETNQGHTIACLKQWAKQYDIALCGSFIATEEGKFYNRAFFITPSKEAYYDKRHLFRMGSEGEKYTAGNAHSIVSYKGFNICMQVCYDLRFPVWARNQNNAYDLLIYVANWPQSRIHVWNVLLQARAIENASYVCGANRIGEDANKLNHNGQSALIDYKGKNILSFDFETNKDIVQTYKINKKELNLFRSKFPVWKDADRFQLE